VIRAVLCDAGATLVHPDPPVEAVYAREFAADGARFSEEELGRALTVARRDKLTTKRRGLMTREEFPDALAAADRCLDAINRILDGVMRENGLAA
jgi:FMN phosphatase YigB (HAD superfamily)